jgi:hypothetical protein
VAEKQTDAGTIKARYDKLIGERSYYLREAFRSALVTLPALVPDEHDIRERTTDIEVAKPFQSLGARGVNNLASKLLLTLFPPTSPFLRYEIIEGEADQDTPETTAMKEQIQTLLTRREAAIQRELDTTGARVKLFLALKLLIVTGNALVYLEPDGALQVFPLNAYVAKRDTIGNPVEVVYVEALDRATVTDDKVREIVERQPQNKADDPAQSEGDAPVHVFTHIQWKGKSVKVRKEVCGEVYREESFSEKTNPFLVLRFTTIDGEDYGRGFVEEYRGDLTSMEELSRAIIFAAANSAMMIPLIHPNGALKPRNFNNAQNGQAIIGRPEDVAFVSADKFADMQVANAARNDLVTALSADFMLNSAFQRQAERVTAEEIRRMAEELEDTLGGTFSVLSQELQLPIGKRYEQILERRGDIRKLPEGSVRLAVVTGLAAIGRGHDLSRLREFLAQVQELATAFPQMRRDEEVAHTRAKEKADAKQDMQRMALMDKVAGPLAKGFADTQGADAAGIQAALGGGATPQGSEQ